MNCLVQAHPQFADVALSRIALPGAENAGTYNLDAQAFDTQSGSACNTFNTGEHVAAGAAQRFSATQDQSVTQQLNDGVRWVDLQVGYNGGGQPTSGWRVVQNLYSNWPLSEYLDQVANWAGQHPNEAVVVDLSNICYDHQPSPAISKSLWANFTTQSTEGAGSKTMADVAADPSAFGGSLATATLGDVSAGHNVIVLIPSSARFWQTLPEKYHIHPVRTVAPGQGTNGVTEVEQSHPSVAPTGPAQFKPANNDLAKYPIDASPRLGALQGSGLYVSRLAYELGGTSESTQNAIFQSFGGLVDAQGLTPAWMSGLWHGALGHILAQWGHSSNVVLANGVEFGDFCPGVIELNGQ